MKGIFSERVTPLITSAMKMACFSLSMTHGPAMRKRWPDPILMPSTWKEILMGYMLSTGVHPTLTIVIPTKHEVLKEESAFRVQRHKRCQQIADSSSFATLICRNDNG